MLWLIFLTHLAAGPAEVSRDQAVERARQALAEELGQDADAIRLVRAEPARWSDDALGCPEPGQSARDVASEGFRVQLLAERRIYAVHVAGQRAVVCGEQGRSKRLERVPESASPPAAAVTGEVPDHIVASVIDDLVEKKGADRAAVEVMRAEAVVWPDGSLGCPGPGRMYTQAQVPGYRVVLGVAGEEYDYRVGKRGWFVLCERGLLQPPGDRPPVR